MTTTTDPTPWVLTDERGAVVLRAHTPEMLHPAAGERVSYEPREDDESVKRTRRYTATRTAVRAVFWLGVVALIWWLTNTAITIYADSIGERLWR